MNDVLSVLRCENCGGMVGSEDLQPENGVAVCSLCRTVLVLEKPRPPAPPPQRMLSAPSHFERAPGRVSWHEPPWAPAGTIMFMAVWYSFWQRLTPFLIAFGALIAYPALARLVNRKVV